jgi:beta-N-acetylhexosaminidase
VNGHHGCDKGVDMGRVRACCAALLVASVLAPAGSRAAQSGDPGEWSNHQLAAQVVLAGVRMDNLSAAESWARAGVGGVVLFGTPPADLAERLRRVRTAGAVPPFVASDEEGGQVQRLASAIYPLPSAEYVGAHRSTAQAKTSAFDYGMHMRGLGVDVSFAPVADLGIPGYYIEQLDRAFSADPARAASYVVAWQAGLRAAHVAPTVKHWPGHGQANNTHDGAATTPPLSTLEQRDLVPFRSALSAGVPIVMVGHLTVPGLTEGSTPASLSPAAMRYLRSHGGANALVVTDSLTMGAIQKGLGLSTAEAAVRALRAGADLALTDNGDPAATISRIERAIATGEYARSRAITSVRRILAVKRFTAAAPVPISAPAAARQGDGGAVVAYLAVAGHTVVRRERSAVWSGLTDLGGFTTSAPAVARAGSTTYVFVRGNDGRVRYRAGSSGVWQQWATLGTAAVGGPAAVGWANGDVTLAVRTPGDRLVVRTRRNGAWAAGIDLGPTYGPPALATGANGELVVLAQTSAHHLQVRSRRSLWGPWVPIGGTAVGAATMAYDAATATLMVAVRGTDSRLTTARRHGTTWSGWTPMGMALSASPALAPTSSSVLTVVVRAGSQYDLWTRTWSGGKWATGYRRWY